ncbi:hypothetical protein F5B22DRAFT_5244 [Xylaria bambusicola]|uniref:uncharacterized protein n=1 Tax=Xylaria bambusicola TaxID=326684 RepID=UPI002007ECAA|nr:uncharacterized protein F5B22DRAFT_5244 [Xylaria bambusicola]KAI0527815.1 hypothetical protein F5B22DRAFT_5244 [Xylaria bambusicola]
MRSLGSRCSSLNIDIHLHTSLFVIENSSYIFIHLTSTHCSLELLYRPRTTLNMEITVRNGISITQIILYVPFLAVATLLCVRHGFGQNAGWLFLFLFSLLRIIGAALQLAATAQPDNIGLFFGALTLQAIGLTDFIVMLLALINRACESAEKARNVLVNPRVLYWAQLLVFVAVILGIVGGTTAGSNYADTGMYKASSVSQASIGLTIAGYVLLVIATAQLLFSISHVEAGERRLVLAIAFCLPFLLVRLLYQAIGTFDRHSAFNSVSGNAYVFLGTAVIEEIIIVVIIEVVGLTLQVRPKADTPAGGSRPLGRLYDRLKGRYDAIEMQGVGQHQTRRQGRRQGRHERRYEQRYGPVSGV